MILIWAALSGGSWNGVGPFVRADPIKPKWTVTGQVGFVSWATGISLGLHIFPGFRPKNNKLICLLQLNLSFFLLTKKKNSISLLWTKWGWGEQFLI